MESRVAYGTLVKNLNDDLKNIHTWLAKNKLQPHPTKTVMMFIGSPYNLKNRIGEATVFFGDKPVPLAHSLESLEVEIDENLSLEKHIDKICKKASASIRAIKRAKPHVDINILQTIYKALVQPYFNYCSTLWGNCGKLLQDKLQRFQSRAARVITGASYDERSHDILNTQSWETLDNRINKSKAVFMYKVLNDHAAPGLRESFYKRNVTQNTYNLRDSENDLTLPKPRTEYLRRSFKYSGAMLWNDLSSAAKSADTLDCFKRETCAS